MHTYIKDIYVSNISIARFNADNTVAIEPHRMGYILSLTFLLLILSTEVQEHYISYLNFPATQPQCIVYFQTALPMIQRIARQTVTLSIWKRYRNIHVNTNFSLLPKVGITSVLFINIINQEWLCKLYIPIETSSVKLTLLKHMGGGGGALEYGCVTSMIRSSVCIKISFSPLLPSGVFLLSCQTSVLIAISINMNERLVR